MNVFVFFFFLHIVFGFRLFQGNFLFHGSKTPKRALGLFLTEKGVSSPLKNGHHVLFKNLSDIIIRHPRFFGLHQGLVFYWPQKYYRRLEKTNVP